jgi:carboxyl-terminal processing protease
MMVRGRTVFAYVVMTLIISVLATILLVGPGGIWTERFEFAAGPDRSAGDQHSQASAGGLSASDMHKLNVTYQLIDKRFMEAVDHQQLVDGAIQGMLSALGDPYTSFMDQEQTGKFAQEVDAFFTGIGAEVSIDNGNIIVVSPIKGSPAEKVGLRSKDIILSVNGESLTGLSLTDAVNKIRGPKGTQAKLQIKREGQEKQIELIVVRDEIDLETVFSEMVDEKIGKIEIRQFSAHTVENFNSQLKDLEKLGLQGLIIDVRSNPGGYLEGVVQILYSLVPKDKILLMSEARDGEKEKVVSIGPGRTYPITVLINGGSASASEILAAAIKQSSGGTLVGETTYGKGTIQSQFSDPYYKDGSLLKLTIAKWLTPDGSWINESGVVPDVEVRQPEYFYVAPISRGEVLKQGDMGEDVKSMQVMLSGIGYKLDRTDGYFSEVTREALKQFQQTVSMESTGELDEKTIDQLERHVIEMLVKPENDSQLQEAIRLMKLKL